MDKTNVQLFGIALILAGGFVLLTETIGGFLWLYESAGTWGILFGLVICFLALLRG
ncbi:hypothetical protein [Haladaptatus cibarius]|uniref:hypothetical protein n=1 Tax=Haladaptatus cibarius TaxID=453847 RepID=UPI000A6BC25B|nr:hypothetical protein [Haladaptatus cibarius]